VQLQRGWAPAALKIKSAGKDLVVKTIGIVHGRERLSLGSSVWPAPGSRRFQTRSYAGLSGRTHTHAYDQPNSVLQPNLKDPGCPPTPRATSLDLAPSTNASVASWALLVMPTRPRGPLLTHSSAAARSLLSLASPGAGPHTIHRRPREADDRCLKDRERPPTPTIALIRLTWIGLEGMKTNQPTGEGVTRRPVRNFRESRSGAVHAAIKGDEPSCPTCARVRRRVAAIPISRL